MWALLRNTFTAWNEHEAPRLGAALAFYSILSIAPLVVVVLAILAMVLGRSDAQDQLLGQVQGMIGKEGADAVKTMIQHAQKPSSGVIASVFGVVTLLFGASGVFGELRSALNRMWDVKASAGSGIWQMVRERLFSFGMVLAVGFLLLVSLMVSAALAAMGKFFGGILPIPEVVAHAITFLVSVAGISVLFALIFKYVPDTKIPWREVWLGAIATAVLFTIGKSLIGLYLGKAAVGSAYGAAGSLVVVIVWIYYSSMIVLFGAQFTRVRQMAGAEGDANHPSEKSREPIRINRDRVKV